MSTFLVILFIILTGVSLKKLIDISLLTLLISKEKEVIVKKNKMNHEYQFIKGLY